MLQSATTRYARVYLQLAYTAPAATYSSAPGLQVTAAYFQECHMADMPSNTWHFDLVFLCALLVFSPCASVKAGLILEYLSYS